MPPKASTRTATPSSPPPPPPLRRKPSSDKSKARDATSSPSGKICDMNNVSSEENRYYVWLDKSKTLVPMSSPSGSKEALAVEAKEGFVTAPITSEIGGKAENREEKTEGRKTIRVVKRVVRKVLKRVQKEEKDRVGNEAEIETPKRIITPNCDIVVDVNTNNANKEDNMRVVMEKVVTKGPERVKRKNGGEFGKLEVGGETEIESPKHIDSDSNDFQNPNFDIVNDVNSNNASEEYTKGPKRVIKEETDGKFGELGVGNAVEIESPKHIVSDSDEYRTPNCDIVNDVNKNIANEEDKTLSVASKKVMMRGPKRVKRKENAEELWRVGVSNNAEVKKTSTIEYKNPGSCIVSSSPKYEFDTNIDTNTGKEEKMERTLRKKVATKGPKREQNEDCSEELGKAEVDNEANTETPNISALGAIEFKTPNSDIYNSGGSVSMSTDCDASGLVAVENINVNTNATEDEKTVRTVRKKIVRVVRKKVVTKGPKRVKKKQPDEELGKVGMLNEAELKNSVIDSGSGIANSCASKLLGVGDHGFTAVETMETENMIPFRVASGNVNTRDSKEETDSGIVSSVEADKLKDPDVANGEGNNCINANAADGPVLDRVDCENNKNEGKRIFSSCGNMGSDGNLEDRMEVEEVGCEGSVIKKGVTHEVESCDVSCVKKDATIADDMVLCEEMEGLERRKRRKTEIFIGGLHKDAVEEDVRRVFREVGEIVEVTVKMHDQTGKNKGFAFVRYASAADAKKALETLDKVEICGKQCSISFVKGNDTIFLGNIDKRWKNEDIVKLLQDVGVEKIDKVTVKSDPENPKRNLGFAFLEIQTIRDARIAFGLLEKKGFLGNRKIRVEWAKEAAEEEMHKVKTVYAEHLPASWDEEKVEDHFKKFGDIENVVLARNLVSSGRKDFAFVNYKTREAAVACIKEFSQDQLCFKGSKVHVNVSLAKSTTKAKQVKYVSDPVIVISNKEKPKAAQTLVQPNRHSKGESTSHYHDYSRVVEQPNQLRSKEISTSHHRDNNRATASTDDELVQLLREQASWRPPQTSLTAGSASLYYAHSSTARKRQFSHLEDDAVFSDPRGYPRPRTENAFTSANPSGLSPGPQLQYLPHYHLQGLSNQSGLPYEVDGYLNSYQTRGGAPSGGSSAVYRRH